MINALVYETFSTKKVKVSSTNNCNSKWVSPRFISCAELRDKLFAQFKRSGNLSIKFRAIKLINICKTIAKQDKANYYKLKIEGKTKTKAA